MATHSSILAWRVSWPEEPREHKESDALKWLSMHCGQGSLRRNGIALIVHKRVRNTILWCNLKNNRMISVCFQGKPFNITVIQVYAATTNEEEAEVELFYEDQQDLLELTPKKKRCHFHHRRLKCKSRKSRDTGSNRQVWSWSTKWSRAKANMYPDFSKLHCSLLHGTGPAKRDCFL